MLIGLNIWRKSVKMHLSNDGNPDPLEMENFMLKSVLGEINTKLDEVFLIHPQIKKAVSK